MPFNAERLKEIRQRRGITQRELAALCGISDVQLSRYENEKMDPSLTNLELISRQLHVSIDYFLNMTDDPNKQYGNESLDSNEKIILEAYRREGWQGVARLSVERLSIIIRGVAMVRIPSHRAPTHPGEMLHEEFLKPMGLTQRELAEMIHVPYQRINEIINEKRGITPSTALRLAKYFGNSADFWMAVQLRWDLYQTTQTEKDALDAIQQRVSS